MGNVSLWSKAARLHSFGIVRGAPGGPLNTCPLPQCCSVSSPHSLAEAMAASEAELHFGASQSKENGIKNPGLGFVQNW